MKERTLGLLCTVLFTSGAFILLVLGCLALKRNCEWLAVLIIMGSLYMMLLVHAELVAGAIRNAIEKAEEGKKEDARN